MSDGKMYRYTREVVCVELGVLWARDLEEAYSFVEEGEGLWPEGRSVEQAGRVIELVPADEEAKDA